MWFYLSDSYVGLEIIKLLAVVSNYHIDVVLLNTPCFRSSLNVILISVFQRG